MQALIKGYKTRKLLKSNEEILTYLSQIKELQEHQDNENENEFENSIKLKLKKHIFIHTVKQLLRGKSKSLAKKEYDNYEHEGGPLMKKYLQNQKIKSAQVSFGPLFDD